MNETELWRIRHMLNSAQEAQTFIQGLSRNSLNADRKLVLALAMEITIIGEAAARISKESLVAYPDIPWSSITGMRNIIVHAYFKIDLDALWEAVTISLAELIPQLHAILDNT
jgi:uncharacterized protein with HEPN domain